MSFIKAEQLLTLATMAVGRHMGVSLEEITAAFGVTKRTAQRMIQALERQFPDVEVSFADGGRKYWRLPQAALRDLLTLTPEELAAFDLALQVLRMNGQTEESTTLSSLRDKVLALVPRSKATRLETDHEALLEAQGFVARPGPRPRRDPEVSAAITEAIKACRLLDIEYASGGSKKVSHRLVEPYGILTGLRRYLVAQAAGKNPKRLQLFRIDAIRSAAVQNESFARDASFNLQAFAQRSFGVFQNEAEYGEVVWRFTPDAAENARNFEFHPDQTFEEQPDGSLLVHFRAAGLLEMAWHLYAWGNKVEVVAPIRLKELVQGYQRDDFGALP